MKIIFLLTLVFVHVQCLIANTVNSPPENYFRNFVTQLTKMTPTGELAVLSSGGAAGGVVSEGQGYGILIGGITAVAMGSSDQVALQDVLNTTYLMWKGWERMCKLSVGGSSCQTGTCGPTKTEYPCLPHWQFDNDITTPQGTGSATDGDADAILGMILMLAAAETARPIPSWFGTVRDWAYQSCKQLLDAGTALNTAGTYRILKLGSCWGGWDLCNPSYFSPAHFRSMRNFMCRYGPPAEATAYVPKWNNLILTSYAVLYANQCPQTGLTTNWYQPNQINPAQLGSVGRSGSGTPAAEYGSEASRGVWRIALDYLLFPAEPNMEGYGPAVYSSRVSKHVMSKYVSASQWNPLDTGCLVTSILNVWQNAFMYGPTITSLLVVNGLTNQQTVLDAAGTYLVTTPTTGYFPVSWYTISALTMAGQANWAAGKVANLGNYNGNIYVGLDAPVAVTPTSCTTPTGQVIFSDFFNPQFDGSRSWGDYNLNDDRAFHTGVSSISQMLRNYGGIQIRCVNNLNCIDPAIYNTVSFWTFSFDSPGQVRVRMRTNDVEVGNTILASYAVNTWTYHSYNLSEFAPGAFNVLQFQDNTGSTQGPTVFYDDIQISCDIGPFTPTPVTAPTVVVVPVPPSSTPQTPTAAPTQTPTPPQAPSSTPRAPTITPQAPTTIPTTPQAPTTTPRAPTTTPQAPTITPQAPTVPGVTPQVPSQVPSVPPTIVPALAPSIAPSLAPSIAPSLTPESTVPSVAPIVAPAIAPFLPPSIPPSQIPSLAPAFVPSIAPSVPSIPPSVAPSTPSTPSVVPSSVPSTTPSPETPPAPIGTPNPSSVPLTVPSTSPVSPPTNSSDSDNGLSSGAIAGIVVGAIVGLVLVIAAVVFLVVQSSAASAPEHV